MQKIKLLSALTILSTILSLGVNFSFAQEDSVSPAALPTSEPAAPEPQPTESNPSPAPPAEEPTPAQETVGESNLSPAAPPAEESELKVQEIINADINITPEDLGVSDQNILPDSPVYPVKEAWREVKFFFTFGDVNEAEQRMQYANEKLIEAKKVAEKTDNASEIENALDNYKNEMAEVKDRVDDIKDKAEQNSDVDKFLENFVDDNLKQQKLMDKIERDSPEEVFGKLNEVKDDALNKFSEISLGVAEPDKLKEKFEKIAQDQKGSEFKEFKNLEVLKQIQDKLPENAKGTMEKVQENMMEKFKEKMGEFSDDKKDTFKKYVENIPGRELKQMEVFHDFENGQMPEAVREIFAETKGLAMKKIEETMMDSGPKERRDMILRDLEGKKMEDVRIIKELEGNLAPEVINKILAIKNKTLDNIRQKIEGADSEEKQREFFMEIEKFHDVKQLEMFKEMEQVIGPEKKEFFEKMKQKAMEEMKNDVDRAGNEMERKMVFQQIASDNPEAMSIIKEFGPPPEMMQEIMKEQIQKLEQKIGNEQDAQKLMILKQRVQEDEIVKNELEARSPEIFKKIDDRQMILNQGMNAETAKQQIEKAKAEIKLAIAEFGTADQTFAQMTPANQLLAAAQKHIANAESLLAEGKEPQHAWGQATAALHEANSVRRIVKEVDLRKEVGQKREDEFRQKYGEMMGGGQDGQSGPGGFGGPNEQGGPFGGPGGEQGGPMGQPGGGFGEQGTMPPPDFSGIDMMKCAMPQKPDCGEGRRPAMKKDENGCPQLFCMDAPSSQESRNGSTESNQPQQQEGSTGSAQPYQPKDRQMPTPEQMEQMQKEQYMQFAPQYPKELYQQQTLPDGNSYPQRTPEPYQQTPYPQQQPSDSSQPYNYPPPEFKDQTMQQFQTMPTERIENNIPTSQPIQYQPPPTGEFKPPATEPAPSYTPPPDATVFEKLGAGIIMFWDGFMELIK